MGCQLCVAKHNASAGKQTENYSATYPRKRFGYSGSSFALCLLHGCDLIRAQNSAGKLLASARCSKRMNSAQLGPAILMLNNVAFVIAWSMHGVCNKLLCRLSLSMCSPTRAIDDAARSANSVHKDTTKSIMAVQKNHSQA